MCGKSNSIQKNQISFSEILYQECEEGLGEFFIFITFDIFFYVVVTTHDEGMGDFLEEVVGEIVPTIVIEVFLNIEKSTLII